MCVYIYIYVNVYVYVYVQMLKCPEFVVTVGIHTDVCRQIYKCLKFYCWHTVSVCRQLLKCPE